MARPRRSDHKRELLLDLGVELMRSQGFHHTGLKQLVDKAGVPKGSFYNYFATKEDFAAAVVKRYADQFEAELSELRAAGASRPGLALRSFFEGLIQRFVDNDARGGCLVGNLGAELDGDQPQVSAALRETMESWRETFTDLIERARDRGEISASRPPAMLADFLINAWEGSLIRMKVQRSIQPLEECIEFVFDDVLGLSGPRRRAKPRSRKKATRR